MPFVKVYIHFVWSTKNRYPFLDSKQLRLKVWNHIRENARGKNIFIDFVNGYSDHCHYSKKTFQEEYDEFISKYGFEKFDG